MTQPESLRLADWLDAHANGPWAAQKQAAAELRRLHSVNAELLEALKEAADNLESWGAYANDYFAAKHDLQGDVNKARVAINKAEGA